MSNEQIILQVGCEGGHFTLYGVQSGDGWLFSLHSFDWTPMLLDEDDGGGPPSQDRFSPVTTWADATALLDRHRWETFYPLVVHPGFRKQVWDAVQKRLDHGGDDPESDEIRREALDRWRRICQIEKEIKEEN